MQYGRVVGRFLAAVADTPQDTDENPDEVPLQGTVTFTPSAAALKVAGQGATILPTPIACQLDSQGYLTLGDKRGVMLIATDTDETNPRDFTYRVDFRGLNYSGLPIKYDPFSFAVPAGQTTDLSVVAPVAEAKGAAIIRGEKGDAGLVSLATAAKSPELLIAGLITRDSLGVIVSAAVVWPDGTPGVFTTDATDSSGAINGYHITYAAESYPQTYTQPTITRDSSGAATNVPQIVVS